MQGGVGAEALGGVLELGEGGDAGEPFSAESAQAAVRGAGGGLFLLSGSGFLGGVPLVDQRLDVALEDFGEVVVAVEFVFIGDAGEGLDGGVNGHGDEDEG